MRVLALLSLCVPLLAAARPVALEERLAQGWAWLQTGKPEQATTAFVEVLEMDGGRTDAETWFALASSWWERRDALVAYSKLEEAEQLAAQMPWAWDPGADGDWDRRIEERRSWIQRNFSAVKFELGGGRVLLPQMLPPPADPLLAEFAAAAQRRIQAAAAAGEPRIWLALPNGVWIVGSDERVVAGGELLPHKALSWSLPAERGGERKADEERRAWLAGRSAEELRLLADRALLRVALRLDGGPRFERDLIDASTAGADSSALSALGLGAAFYGRWAMSCSASCPVLLFPDSGAALRFDGGELRVDGARPVRLPLGAAWRTGPAAGPNIVEVTWDGQLMDIAVNGAALGRFVLRREGANAQLGSFRFVVAEGSLQHVRFEPLPGAD